MAGLDQSLTGIVAGAPDLLQTPSLALGLAQGFSQVSAAGGSTTPQQIGTGASTALMAQGLNESASQGSQPVPDVPQQHPHHGLFGWLGAKFGDAMNLLNKPLQEVQHTYRYFHDVWERHGVLAALGEIGVAAGAAVGGTVLSGGNIGVGIMAGEAAADLEGRLTYSDSWKATQDGAKYRDPHTGLVVTPGEDLANLVDHLVNGRNYVPNKGVDMPTGALNAVFDLTFDPLMKAGAIFKEARATGLMVKGERGLQIGGKSYLVGNVPRTLVDSEGNKATDILDIYQKNPGVADAFDRMPNMTTKEIITEWPSLRQDFAAQLSKQSDGAGVAQVFANAINTRNYSFLHYGLPTTSLTRRIAANVGLDLPSKGSLNAGIQNTLLRTRELWKDEKGNVVAPGTDGANPVMSLLDPASPVMIPTKAGRIMNSFSSYAPFAFNSKTLDLSAREGNPNDPEFMRALYSVVRHSQDASTANNVLAKYIEAGPENLGARLNIIKNAYRDAFRASGLPDDSDLVQRFTGEIGHLVSSGAHRIYALDEFGNAIKMVDSSGNITNTGLFINQTGNIAFPDFSEWKTATADAQGGMYARLVHMGDSINRNLMTKYFKRLVLLSGGFALRVASGELIPAMLHQSAKEVGQAGFASLAQKLNPEGIFDLAPEVGEGPKYVKGFEDTNASLYGVRATVPGRRDVGRVADWSRSNQTVDVKFADGMTETHPGNRIMLYHRDVTPGQIYKLANGMQIPVGGPEIPHIRAAIGKALMGIPKALVDKDYVDVAGMNIIKNDGHIVAQGLSSDHEPFRGFGGMQQNVKDILNELGRKTTHNEDFTDQFRLWNAGQPEQPLMWNYALKEAAKDPGMRAGAGAFRDVLASGGSKVEAQRAAVLADRGWMEGNSAEAKSLRSELSHYDRSPNDHATLRSEALKGLVYGRQGEFLHQQILEDLANGQATPVHELMETDLGTRPTVKGREIEPTSEQPTTFDKVVNKAWKPLHQTINSLSRAPLWTTYVTDEYKMYRPWIDSGLMTKSEAHDIAQVRALNRMLPNIHNTLLRSQFALAARNVYPFYFAQEQAYKRYFRAAFSDPLAFREASLALQGLTGSGAITSDQQGNKFISFPGMGSFGQLFTAWAANTGMGVGGVPGMVSGDTISLKSVIPEGNAPSFSPLVAIPLKQLANHWHTADPFVKSLLGDVSYNSSMDAELIPNATVRRVWEALDPNAQSQAFGETYSQTAVWAMHKATNLWAQAEKIDRRATDPSIPRDQLVPAAAALMAQADKYMPLASADPSTVIAANQRLRNSTRIMLMVKAAIGMISPLSPQMQVGDVQLRNEYAGMIKQYKNIVLAHQAFMDKHPDATADTVFQSASPTGTYVPATQGALDWINKNYSWVKNNQLVAAYLLPQDGGAYSSLAYHEELQTKIRQRYNDLAPVNNTSNTFLGALYSAMGNAEYIPSLKDYQAARAQAQGDSYTLHNLSQSWQAYVADLTDRNPVWYDSEFSANKYTTALQSYDQLQKAVNSPNTPQSPQVDIARELIASYQDFQSQDALIKSGQGSMTQTQLKQSWYDYLDQLVQQNPAAQPIAYGIFRRLAAKA